jgi:hypothetical protein
LGLCKSPNSAGRVGNLVYDLVPGKPEESILVARMESARPKEMMPQIGRSVVHQEGLALIREWVRSLPASDAPCAYVGGYDGGRTAVEERPFRAVLKR